MESIYLPKLKAQKKISIILPTYNEKGNIVRLISEIINISKHINSKEIIVVDDNSPDRTAQIVKKAFKHIPLVKVIIRKKNRGLAASILAGIVTAKGSHILVMDTDFNHDPKVIGQMLKHFPAKDLVIGSRFVKEGGMENKIRELLSKIFNMYLRIILNHTISDSLSGFFIIKRSKLRQLDLKKIFFGFGDFFIRLVYIAYVRELKIKEVPVYYKKRVYGKSKSKFFSMFINYSTTALKLRFNSNVKE